MRTSTTKQRRSFVFRALTWCGPLAMVGLVWCAAPRSAESAPSTAFAGFGEKGSDSDDETFEEGPSANCPIDAGRPDSGTKKANGEPCESFRECESGFCSRVSTRGNRTGFCASCTTPVCNVVSLHGRDEVIACITQAGNTMCTSAKHAPCLGTHDNVFWEVCIPGQRPDSGRGVKCDGPAPAAPVACGATLTSSNCSGGGDKPNGLWASPGRRLSLLCQY